MKDGLEDDAERGLSKLIKLFDKCIKKVKNTGYETALSTNVNYMKGDILRLKIFMLNCIMDHDKLLRNNAGKIRINTFNAVNIQIANNHIICCINVRNH